MTLRVRSWLQPEHLHIRVTGSVDSVVAVDKIAIIGCGGFGKTYLANRMAALLDIPPTHLDSLYYDTDWNPLPNECFTAIQRNLVARRRWLIDGNYASTLPIRLAAADTVIFLDLPAITCLTSILRRRLRYRGGQHTKDGVYDRLTWNFARYVWNHRTTMCPGYAGSST